MKKKSVLMCLALVMSLAMAISGTLAYLTDEETTTNIMTVGNVKIEQMENGEEGFKDGQPLYPAVLNEDGTCIGAIDKVVTIKNVGSSDAYVRSVIAFPYVGGKPVDNEEGSLIVVDAATPDYIVNDVDINGVKHSLWVYDYDTALVPGAVTEPSLRSFYMSPEATNEDLEGFDGFYPVLAASQAVQTTNMKDAAQALELGFGGITAQINPWTKGHGFESAATQDELNAALAQGDVSDIYLQAGTYALPTKNMQNKEITFSGDKDVVVDLSDAPLGHTQAASGAAVTFEGVTVRFDDKENYAGLAHTKKVVFKDCTILGKQTLYADAEFINCEFINKNDYSIWTWGAKNVTFTDCTFTSGGKALLVYADTATENFTVNVNVENCVFTDDGTLNTVKAAVETGSNPKSNSTVYKINVKNSTVVGFAVNDEGTSTGSVLWGNKDSMDDAHLIVTVDGDCKTVATVSTQMGLENLIANAAAGETTIVPLDKSEGGYTLPTKDMQNKDITFIGTKETVVDLSDAPLGHTQAASGAAVTFEGVTVEFDDTKNYAGLAHTKKVVFKDCTILGKQTLYADAEFINCEFVNKNDYSIWTWGAKNVTFTDCTFISGGKALLVYADTATENFTVNVNLTNCVFTDDDTLNTVKAAVETGSNPKSATTVYNISMDKCTVTGFAENDEGTATGTTFFGNKNAMAANYLNVVIDGKNVY